jgi:hypothetical protein
MRGLAMFRIDLDKQIFNGNELRLSEQGINDSEIINYIVPFLEIHPEIKMLSVEKNNIGEDGAKALAANTSLTILYLNGNNIGVDGAKALATNTSLINLNVARNKIGDEGAKALAANTVLTTLGVAGNKIGDEGAKALAANTTLTTLLLLSNKIGDEGAKALAANTALTFLSLLFNEKIGSNGIKALASNTSLTTLEVDDMNDKTLNETDPLKRANLGREAGLKIEVPSLKRLTLFKVKQEFINQDQLPNDLKDDLKKPKV